MFPQTETHQKIERRETAFLGVTKTSYSVQGVGPPWLGELSSDVSHRTSTHFCPLEQYPPTCPSLKLEACIKWLPVRSTVGDAQSTPSRYRLGSNIRSRLCRNCPQHQAAASTAAVFDQCSRVTALGEHPRC